MKKIKFSIFFILLFFLVPFYAHPKDWHTEASLTITKPGLIEAALPPELHRQLDDGLDLNVSGPDCKSRSFELYWHEDQGDTFINLTEKSAKLDNNIFIWEALIPANDRIKVKSVKIEVLSSNYIGTVDIFGLKEGTWINLARQSALYASEGRTRGDIKIEENIYEGFRLEFTAYSKKPVPIGQVQTLGEKPGKDYAKLQIGLKYQRTDRKDSGRNTITNLTAVLPGSGLYIEDLELLTTALFNGNWTLERQDMLNAQKTLIAEMNGAITGVEKGTAALKIKVNRVWHGNVLNLKLTSSDVSLSDVKNFNAKIRLPRLVFLADAPGAYFVRTGLNHKVEIRQYPSAIRSDAPVAAQFSVPEINPNPTRENPAAKYQLGGAPFKADGYQWRSGIQLSGPGYYRFILHQRASLEDNIKSLRIVRNGHQYPYFIEQGLSKECDLTIRKSHDQASNTTTWHLELPQASSHWSNLILKTSGIFNRTIKVERDQPKPVQGVAWRILQWSNSSASPSELVIPLRGFPREETKIRLVMQHGDNKPLEIEKAKVTYEAPAIHFLADETEGYELYGGNKEAQAPSYDMQLVQDQLRKQEPLTAHLSEPQMLDDRPLKNALIDFFARNNWGLYAVLGLLSFGLIVIIVFVFPRPKNDTTEG